MNKNGPIVIIEDNPGAQQLLSDTFEDLPYSNKLEFFYDGDDALQYLKQCEIIPFLILSDVNMPKLDGFTLKGHIQDNLSLQLKSIPFIFFSTAASRQDIQKAYLMSAQGFFIKPDSIMELETTIKVIMQYWSRCLSPTDR